MAKLVSRIDKIIARLKKEGKVKEVNIDSSITEMKQVRKDYIRKSQASWIAAKDVWLD